MGSGTSTRLEKRAQVRFGNPRDARGTGFRREAAPGSRARASRGTIETAAVRTVHARAAKPGRESLI